MFILHAITASLELKKRNYFRKREKIYFLGGFGGHGIGYLGPGAPPPSLCFVGELGLLVGLLFDFGFLIGIIASPFYT